MQLRPYQQQVKDEINASWSNGVTNVMAVMPTGAGKTVLFSEIVKDCKGASCAIAHRQELVTQISLALARDGVRHSIIAPQKIIKLAVKIHMEEVGRSWIDPSAKCMVAGVDTLIKRDNLGHWLRTVKLWVMDECFIAGTMVDGKPIEQIKVGDFVTAFNEHTKGFEQRRVERLFKNPAPHEMVRIVTRSHHVLECTKCHPIWTQRGWVNAGEINETDEVLINEMRNVQHSSEQKPGRNVPLQKDGSSVLQQTMFKRLQSEGVVRNNDEDKQEIRIGTHEEKQPDAERKIASKNVGHFETNRTWTEGSGRKRETTNRRRNAVGWNVRERGFRKPTGGVDRSRSACNRFAKSLQDRLWPQWFKGGNRGRRTESWSIEKTRTGREKRQVSNWCRLESVSIFKRQDLERDTSSLFDGNVYNIEVEGLHTYIANDIVVHNCHHVLKSNKWGKAVDLFPNARGLGVTATPTRADGQGLGDHHDGVFEAMVEGPTMRDLIDSGFLTEYRIFAPPSDIDFDLVDTSSTTGDYSKNQLTKAVRKSHVVGDVVDHYKRIASGKLGITFATDVETATDIAKQFNTNGVPAEVVSAKTPDSERIDVIRRFKRRELLQLVNVDLFGEGFDLPAIEVVSMARPTQSYSLFAQQFGRALRLLDGKTEAIIIDHVGNVVRHGLPDAARVWSLDRRDKRGKSGDTDAIPLRACVECTGVYDRSRTCCPYCGFAIVPADRSGPEAVDGDLVELDATVLAQMRGELTKMDMSVEEYSSWISGQNIPMIAQRANVKRHLEKQESQATLREIMGWWAGYAKADGKTDREIHKMFYLTFKIDVMTAQSLNKRDSSALAERVLIKLGELI